MTGSAALAQTETPPPQTPPPESAAQGEEQTILVTAQRREQALEDVSPAVIAVGAERLADPQVNNLQDLQSIVPMVNFGNDFNQVAQPVRRRPAGQHFALATGRLLGVTWLQPRTYGISVGYDF